MRWAVIVFVMSREKRKKAGQESQGRRAGKQMTQSKASLHHGSQETRRGWKPEAAATGKWTRSRTLHGTDPNVPEEHTSKEERGCTEMLGRRQGYSF